MASSTSVRDREAGAPSLWTPLTGAAHAVALEVLLDGPLPRSELARRLDLSPGSLTRLSKPLLDSGLLVETGTTHDTASGRPTRPLDVDETSHHFVGVKLTAHTAHAVATTLRARIVAAEDALLVEQTPQEVVQVVGALVRSVLARPGRPPLEARALGVSIGGLVGPDSTVRSAGFLDWEDVPLGRLLEAEVGLPVVVDNDLMSLTRAEQWFGAARGCDHFAVLTVGEGVGYGLVVHGKVVDRPDAGVGLVGHFPLDPHGPLCPQGHAGCADAMLSSPGIAARASTALRRPVHPQQLLQLAEDGDALARRIVDDSARALGRLVAAVGNLTMPKKIILSGEGVGLAEVGATALREGIAHDRSAYASELDIEVQVTGFTEWARGAAVTAIRTFVLGERR